MFSSLLGKGEAEARLKLEAAWSALFYGNDETERLYYPAGEDMAYVEDIGSGDVRSEGMSYGMMIAVQLDRKDEFDRIWKWTKTHMFNEPPSSYAGYFAWHCDDAGRRLHDNPASDGEEWFAMALFFASARWGEGAGIFAYRSEAQAILDAMLRKRDESSSAATSMFDPDSKLVVFVPTKGPPSRITDPSYHLPHYYELWALWADKDQAFWKEAAGASRAFLKKAVHPITGLAPDYAAFDGSPADLDSGGHDAFRYDAWRVAANVAVDYLWFKADGWEALQSDRLLAFFRSQGSAYGNSYTVEGKALGSGHSIGLVAMNAVACLAATGDARRPFLQALWDSPIPSGPWRYYDGLLYMLAFLQLSGNFRAYGPRGDPACGR